MRVSFRGSNRLIGDPSTFLLGPRLGSRISDATYEEIQAYRALLDRATRKRIPPALFHVHHKMLAQRDQILGCESVGEELQGWAVDYIEDGDYEGWQGWGKLVSGSVTTGS